MNKTNHINVKSEAGEENLITSIIPIEYEEDGEEVEIELLPEVTRIKITSNGKSETLHLAMPIQCETDLEHDAITNEKKNRVELQILDD